MSEWKAKAAARLEDECKSGKFDKYGSAMKQAVKTALLDFCRQDDEFAQAVVQGGSFTDYMDDENTDFFTVGKKVKNGSISDLDAYSAAVGFYFPGARISFEMRIELCEHDGDEISRDSLLVDLSAFL
mgnify:CR=1 FL=1